MILNRQKLPAVWLAALGLLLSGCTTTVVNFDTLPGGATVTGQSSNRSSAGSPINPQAVISNQYATVGATFASGSAGLLALTDPTDAPSPPNVACPISANNQVGIDEASTITISTQGVCDVWVTLTGSSGSVTMTAFDVGGNAIGTPAQRVSGTTSNPSPGAQTLHINACTIASVVLKPDPGNIYCFDDVKWQHWIWN